MGAGGISNKFCDAVSRLEGCEVAAVASKSLERAEAFAKKNGLKKAYGNYQEMLEAEKPDCVYIGADTGSHFRLSMLCLEHHVPILCEKAMFRNSTEAQAAFSLARKEGVFAMEAMWSRFLPSVRQVKDWVEEGRIGQVSFCDAKIGFKAPVDPTKRYYSKELGGGAAFDLTVYTYELSTFFLGKDYLDSRECALWGDTGVDLVNQVTLRYPNAIASLSTSFLTPLEERVVLCGDRGKIVLPRPHFADEAFLYDEEGRLVLHDKDDKTVNGFVYEAKEAMDCIRAGKLESDVIPQEDTLDCARLFDRIAATRQ